MLWRELTVVALVVATGLTACGSDPPPGDDGAGAATAVRAIQRAFDRHDLAAICSRMTDSAKRQAGLMAHGTVDGCSSDLREALRVVGKSGWRNRGDAGKVTAEDERATVSLAAGGRPPVDVFLLRRGDSWRIDSFFGVPPSLAKATAKALESSTGPGALATGTLTVSTKKVTIDIATVFGDFEFDECTLEYQVLANDRGATWTDGVNFNSFVNNGCADVRPCQDSKGEDLPWKGRIRANGRGRLLHEMEACLDTCVGFFTGTITTRLIPTASGDWRVVPTAGTRSGFRFTGAMRGTSVGFEAPGGVTDPDGKAT